MPMPRDHLLDEVDLFKRNTLIQASILAPLLFQASLLVVDFARMQRSNSSPSCGSSSDATKRRLSVASILNEQGSVATPSSTTDIGQRRGRTPKPDHRPLSIPHYPMSSPQYQSPSPLTTTVPVAVFHRPSAYRQTSTPSATNPNPLQVGQSEEIGSRGRPPSPIALDYGAPSATIFRRAPLTSESQRRELLENDPWSDKSQLTPHSIVCRGCGRTLALDKNPARKYYPGHWKHHRSRCAAIQIKKETLNLPQEDGYWDSFSTQ